jgi:hypothetical protein
MLRPNHEPLSDHDAHDSFTNSSDMLDVHSSYQESKNSNEKLAE